MALTNIEYGSIASSKLLNDNFNYLEDKIEDYSKNISADKASLMSLINSQIETVNAQFTAKFTANLQAIYPIGSIYIGTTDNCPIASLFGTWEKVSVGRVLQGVTGSQVPGETVEAGLPNITGQVVRDISSYAGSGNYGATSGGASNGWGLDNGGVWAKIVKFDASKANPIYKDDCDTVQPPAYLVNIWRRTA